MQLLCVLGIHIVCRAVELDGGSVVAGPVKFGDVERFMDAKIDKNIFVGVKVLQSIVEKFECLVGVDWILGEVEKVEKSMYTLQKTCVGESSRQRNSNGEAQEKAAHLIMLLTRDTRKGWYPSWRPGYCD